MAKKFVVVLGPHRSGTSLITSALEGLGAELSLSSRPFSEENLHGFFEHQEVVALNERLLEFLGGRWDNPLFDGQKAICGQSKEQLQPWLDEASNLIRNSFAGHGLFALKDPRICQLLPFWIQVFNLCGLGSEHLYFMHICRHPAAVAASQAKRYLDNPDFYGLGANIEEGAALWLSLTCQALQTLPSDHNLMIEYDQLARHPQMELQRVAKFLDLTFSISEIEEVCSRVVDRSLSRSHYTLNEVNQLSAVLPQSLTIFEGLQDLSRGEEFSVEAAKALAEKAFTPEAQEGLLRISSAHLSRLALDRQQLRFTVNEAEVVRRKLFDELEGKRKELDHYEAAYQEKIFQQQKFAEEKQSRLEEAHREEVRLLILEAEAISFRFRKTVSWRITAPLRWLRGIQGQVRLRIGTVWLRMRGKARNAFLRFRKSSPRLADFALRLIRPAFRLVDQALLKGRGRSNEPMCTTGGGAIADLTCQYIRQDQTEGFEPLVTVVVPNYNHAAFLRARLDSIYNQTYKKLEVILLDDCSTDGSRIILEEYRGQYPDCTRILFNQDNSGSVFRQWKKALEVATGEIVWIAESDDWCDDNFLEELVPSFRNDAVRLAYSRTDFMNQSGDQCIWTMEQFLADIDPGHWQRSFLMTAHQLVAKAWSKKNIVPNVSSALFRNIKGMPLMQDEDWQRMRIAGDWVFYLHAIRGGLVAYSVNTVNYHRMHDANTSTATYATDAYYREHEVVAKTVNRLYEVQPQVFADQREIIRQHWLQNREDFSERALDRCYEMNAIRAAGEERKPNLLMASFAFSAGGGETFPIQLANLFSKRGYAVTFLNCDQDKSEAGVREMLRPEIPVVNNLAVLPEIVEDFGIELIHSHHAWVDMSILDLLPEESRCNTVVSLHGMYETIPENQLRTILPRLLEKTGSLVYTADKNLGSIIERGLFQADRFTKIGNALDVFPVNPIPREDLGISDDAFVLCNVSRAIPEKGWQESVATTRRAREISGKDIHLLLIGEGPEYDQLQKSGCPDYVHLLGFRGNIRDFYAASDLGFLPSKFRGESFPLVVIDCLHAGTPVMASSLGEIPQMLDADGAVAGVLFDLDDWELPIETIAQEIAHCATDSSYFAQCCDSVALAVEKFSPQVMCDKYDEVYVSLVAKNNL